MIVLIIAAIVVGLGGLVSRIWTDYLWFAEVGQTTVFWTPLVARICVGLFFGVIFFVILYGNLWLARKISPRLLAVQSEGDEDVLELKPNRKWPGRLLLLIAIALSIVVGATYSSRWEEVLLFLNRGDFGYTDPLFGKDASFFVFTLPVWDMLVDFVGVALLFTFVATALVYLADRALVLDAGNRIRLAPHVKAHLSVILAAAMVAKAGDYMIQTWALDYSTRGVVFGASYTDVHASLPVLHFLAIVSLVAAVLFLANIRYKGWRLPAIAIAVMFLTWALAGKVYPAIVQQYKVSPNEITAESPYIADNIEATSYAFGLGNITSVPHPATADLTAAEIKDNEAHSGQRPLVGTAAGLVHLLPDPGDPPLLLVHRRRCRPLHRRRQVPSGAHQRPGARPEPAADPVADLGEPASHLHPRLRVRHEPGERSRRRRPAPAVGARHPTAYRHRPQDHQAGDLLRRVGQRVRRRQDDQSRVRLSQGRHE